MNKKCALTIIFGAILLVAALTFIPISILNFDSNGRPVGDHTKWMRYPDYSGFRIDGSSGRMVFVLSHPDIPVRRDILGLEILGIVGGTIALCLKFRKK
jgi:hypothetical protein